MSKRQFNIRKCVAWYLVLAAIGGASSAQADVTVITVTTPNPRLGLMIQATAPNDGNPPPVVGWSFVVAASYGGSAWFSALTSTPPNMQFVASVPATYAIACTVTYGGRMPPPPKIVKPTSITIAPPDDVKINSPNPTPPTPALQPVQWDFLVQTGGQNCGGMMVGLAQERVTHRTDWKGNALPDMDWGPPAPSPTFHLAANHIFDTHNPDTSNWPSIRVGATMGFVQNLRIHFTYPDKLVNGVPVPVTQDCILRSVRYTMTKADAQSWTESASLQ